MKPFSPLRTYLSALGKRCITLLAAGLIPIFLALLFLVIAHLAPTGSSYGTLWLERAFALWVDSVGLSLLLLVGGAALLDYAEKHDNT